MTEKEVVDGRFVKWFSELSGKDSGIAGNKGTSLAEMYNNKFPVPPGFVITTNAYNYFIEKAGLEGTIKILLDRADINDVNKLKETSDKIRGLIESAELPQEITSDIMEAYETLGISRHDEPKDALDVLSIKKQPFIAVRASAPDELADASLVKCYESLLGVKGENITHKVKKCMSSLFTPRSIEAIIKKKLFPSARLAVVIQKMVNAEKSGIVFSRTGVKNKDTMTILALFGLGESLASNETVPDKYSLNNENILSINISDKKSAVVRTPSGTIEKIKLEEEQAKKQVLSRYEIKRLGQYASQLQDHFKEPQDIEFAIARDEIYLVQSTPVSIRPEKLSVPYEEEPEKTEDAPPSAGNIQLSKKTAKAAISYGPPKKTHDPLSPMEEEVLKALDDDYVPGVGEKKEDIPALNDAIPVDSEHFN